jgi:hypothetical protein
MQGQLDHSPHEQPSRPSDPETLASSPIERALSEPASNRAPAPEAPRQPEPRDHPSYGRPDDMGANSDRLTGEHRPGHPDTDAPEHKRTDPPEHEPRRDLDEPSRRPEPHHDRPTDAEDRPRDDHGKDDRGKDPDEHHGDRDKDPDEHHDDDDHADPDGPEPPGDEPKFDTMPLLDKYHGEHLGQDVFRNGPVRYLDEIQRQDFRLHVDKDGLLRNSDGDLFDTADAVSAHGGPGGGRATFVMDKNGDIYSSLEQKVGRFHHSSFLGGEPVAAAGELGVTDGKVHLVTNNSGHYQPNKDSTMEFMQHLFKEKSATRENFNVIWSEHSDWVPGGKWAEAMK